MNKSELIILKELKEIDELKEYNMILKDKVEQLQDRIDKAVEIIEKHKDYKDEGLLVEETINLLDILKGE